MNNSKYKSPDWYDESKLLKVYYAKGYSGWVIDLGDGTCRFVNSPLLGNKGPNWGDRVRLIKTHDDSLGFCVDISEILERYNPEIDCIEEK